MRHLTNINKDHEKLTSTRGNTIKIEFIFTRYFLLHMVRGKYSHSKIEVIVLSKIEIIALF